MWIRRQATAIHFLTEVVHLLVAQAPFEISAGVNTGRRMSLDIQQVAAMLVIRGMEKMVETDVIQGCRRGEAGDMATDTGAFLVGLHHRGDGIPADQGADAALQREIAGEMFFLRHRNGIEISRAGRIGQIRAASARLVDHLLQQKMSALHTFQLENRIQSIQPLLRFLRVHVGDCCHYDRS